MNYLQKNFPLLSDRYESTWDKFEIPNIGTYVGQIDDKTGNIHGKGIYFWTEQKKKYIGFFSQGKMDRKGVILDDKNKLIYEGEYKDGN